MFSERRRAVSVRDEEEEGHLLSGRRSRRVVAVSEEDKDRCCYLERVGWLFAVREEEGH